MSNKARIDMRAHALKVAVDVCNGNTDADALLLNANKILEWLVPPDLDAPDEQPSQEEIQAAMVDSSNV